MGQEIERKFLVVGESWRDGADGGMLIRQGYLSSDPHCSVRVRLRAGAGFLTIKGLAKGIVRPEFEYEIPAADAETILATLCAGPKLEKRRHHVRHGGHVWEVDEFMGANQGLVVAEIELEAEDEVFAKPLWLGKEVSDDPRFLNSQLAERPYTTWD